MIYDNIVYYSIVHCSLARFESPGGASAAGAGGEIRLGENAGICCISTTIINIITIIMIMISRSSRSSSSSSRSSSSSSNDGGGSKGERGSGLCGGLLILMLVY